jgi:phosphomevalonate kinase
MLSSILRSERAVQVNIQIMRVYNKMKELVQTNKDILMKLESLEKDSIKHDKEIKLIFDSIRRLIVEPIQRTQRIGFKKNW